MADPRFMHYLRLWIVLTSFVFTSACSTNILYEGDDFTFSAPARYKTKVYEPPYFNTYTKTELLLFSNPGHYPFLEINRQKIPAESDLNSVLKDYMSKNSRITNYQFLYQKTITMNNRTAIEYMHCEFLGEPYVQSREIWMEYNGWAYALNCVHTGMSPCATIPLSDQCNHFFEGFQFK